MQNGAKGLAKFRRPEKRKGSFRASKPVGVSRKAKCRLKVTFPGLHKNGATNEGSPSSKLRFTEREAWRRNSVKPFSAANLLQVRKLSRGGGAGHLGAAQVSVREALNILITEGFVTKRAWSQRSRAPADRLGHHSYISSARRPGRDWQRASLSSKSCPFADFGSCDAGSFAMPLRPTMCANVIDRGATFFTFACLEKPPKSISCEENGHAL